MFHVFHMAHSGPLVAHVLPPPNVNSFVLGGPAVNKHTLCPRSSGGVHHRSLYDVDMAPDSLLRLPRVRSHLLADAAVLLAHLVAVHDGLRRPAHALAPRPVRSPRQLPRWPTTPCTRTGAMEPSGVAHILTSLLAVGVTAQVVSPACSGMWRYETSMASPLTWRCVITLSMGLFLF